MLWIIDGLIYGFFTALYTLVNQHYKFNGYLLGIWRGFGISFFFLPFSPGDAYNTRFFSGILLIRFFCNFSLRTAGSSLFTAFSSDVDFFKVSFFLFFQD